MNDYIVGIFICIVSALLLLFGFVLIFCVKKLSDLNRNKNHTEGLQSGQVSVETSKKTESQIAVEQKKAAELALDILKQDYGITLEPINPSMLEGMGFQLLSADIFAYVSASLQQVPGLAYGKSLQKAYCVTYSEAYRKIAPRGLENAPTMVIQKRIDENPGVAVETLEYLNERGVAGHGVVSKIEPPNVKAQQIAFATFSAAAIVTNQYFLARIDKKLDTIQKTVADVLEFLESDKKAQLRGDFDYLKNCYDDFNQIQSSPGRKQAVLTQIEGIKKEALHNIQFYSEHDEKYVHLLSDEIIMYHSKIFKNRQKLSNATHKAEAYISGHWLSVYVYEFASVLELLLTEETIDSEYIGRVRNQLQKYIDKYKSISNRYSALTAQHNISRFWNQVLHPIKSSISSFIEIFKPKVAISNNLPPLQQLTTATDNLKTFEQLYNGPLQLAIFEEEKKVYLKVPKES